MSKADAKRAQIVDRLGVFLLTEGLDAASLRPLAQAAGLSDRMLLYYFRDKEEVLTATLTHGAAQLTLLLDAALDATPRAAAELERDLLGAMEDGNFWPFTCLWFEIAARSARGDPLYRRVGGAIAHGFLGWIADRLAIDDPVERSATARRLLSMIEGAQLLHAVGLKP